MAKCIHTEETKEQLVDYFCKQVQVKRLTSTLTPSQHSEHGVPHIIVWNIRALLSPGVEQIDVNDPDCIPLHEADAMMHGVGGRWSGIRGS